jgi:hypothetical protein
MASKQTVRTVVLACALVCLTTTTTAQELPPPLPAPSEGAPVAPAPGLPADTDPAPVVDPLPASEPVGALDSAGPAEPPPSVVSPTPSEPDPALVAQELDARIAALDAYLKDQQPRSRSYFGAWISMMSVLTGGQALQAIYSDDAGTRASYIAGSSFSAAGLLLVLTAPTPGRYAYRKFSELPANSLEEKRRKARLGEEWLEGEANAVRRTKSWFTHTIGLVLGVGGFCGLYFGYDDNLENALRTGVGTILVTELRIWTRPYRAIRYLDAYRRAPTTTPAASTFAFSPLLLPHAQGLVMAGRF